MRCSECQQPISKQNAIVEDQTYYCRRCRKGDSSPNIIIVAMNKPAFWVVMIIFFLLAFGLMTVVILVTFRKG